MRIWPKVVVLITTAVSPGVRGELSRWMIEVDAGVFVGNVSARIREKLWEKLICKLGTGCALMIFSSKSEQGFTVRSEGILDRTTVDLEGLTLMRFKKVRKGRSSKPEEVK